MKRYRIRSRTLTRRASNRASAANTVALSAITLGAALMGCADLQDGSPRALRIEPVLRVDGGSTAPMANGYLALARRYAGEGRWALAADAYRHAAMLDARSADVHNELGRAEAMLQRYPAAVAAFEHAVALAPERVDLHNNLGYALLLDGRPALAAAVLSTAVQRAPDYVAARTNLQLAEERVAALRSAPGAARVAQASALPAMPQAATPRSPAESPSPVAQAPVAATAPTPAQATRSSTAPPPASVTPTSTAPPPTPAAPMSMASTPPSPSAIASTAAPTVQPVETKVGQVSANATVTPAIAQAPAVVTSAALPIAAPTAALRSPATTLPPPPAVMPSPAPALPLPTAALPAPKTAETRVQVVNGIGVTGAAARLKRWLGDIGLAQVRLANLPPYTTDMTTVRYAPGFERQAREISRLLPMSSMLDPGTTGGRFDVRVVIGHDVVYSRACSVVSACPPETRVSQSGPPGGTTGQGR